MRLFLAVLILLFQNYPQAPNIQKQEANPENNEVYSTHILTSSAAIWEADEETKAHQDENANGYDPSEDRLYRWYLRFTIIGVIGGFIGIGVLIWQATLTRVSADAARDAAIAARTSSQAIINSERPWLFIDIIVHNQAFAEGVPEHLLFSVSFHNYGKTPAEVVGWGHHTECVPEPDDMPWPPKYHNQGSVLAHTRMVPPGEKWRYPGESSIRAESYLLEDQWRDIRGSRRRLVHWGRIQYRDLIEESKTIHEAKAVGTIHETGFCYFWSPALNDFLICGPVGYNKHT